MEMKVSQLVPGLKLAKDVNGKTNYPIVSKDTILTDEHILVLRKFLVDKVEVSKTHVEGGKFKTQTLENTNVLETNTNKNKTLSFHEFYDNALIKYKDHFNQWQNNVPINISEIREFLLPLIEASLEDEITLFKLHQYTSKEDYLYHHTLSVSLLASYLARKMGFEKGESIQVGLAGLLSNVGMAKVDPNILAKEDVLTYIEREEINKHPSYSYLLVKPIQMIKESVKLAVLQHHERLDGSGYPLGLVGDQINQYARIIAVCDTYHAMTSERKYQKRQSSFKAMEELRKNQFIKFDSQIVQIFIKSFMNLLLGEKVKLSNNQVGKIIFIDIDNLMTPLIMLEEDERIYSLKDGDNVFISDFI